MAESEQKWIVDVGVEDFEREVLDRSREVPVAVYFWSEKSPPCQVLGPLFQKLATELAGEFVLARVDVDRSPDLAELFRVQAIPLVAAFRDGKIADAFEGSLQESEVREFVDRLRPTEAERLVRAAAERGDSEPRLAEDLYRKALQMEVNNEKALLGLTELLVKRAADVEAGELLERLGPGGEHKEQVDRWRATVFVRGRGAEVGDEVSARTRLDTEPENAEKRYELGCALAAAGKYPEALEHLLQAAESDKTIAHEKVRELMVNVFHLIGDRGELTDKYRKKLTAALY